MGKSIDPSNGPGAGRASKLGSRFHPAPQLIGSMSLQLAIPWRVALQQSPPPLHQPGLSLKHLGPNDNQNPANGELSKLKPSHSRGSPQPLSSAAPSQIPRISLIQFEKKNLPNSSGYFPEIATLFSGSNPQAKHRTARGNAPSWIVARSYRLPASGYKLPPARIFWERCTG